MFFRLSTDIFSIFFVFPQPAAPKEPYDLTPPNLNCSPCVLHTAVPHNCGHRGPSTKMNPPFNDFFCSKAHAHVRAAILQAKQYADARARNGTRTDAYAVYVYQRILATLRAMQTSGTHEVQAAAERVLLRLPDGVNAPQDFLEYIRNHYHHRGPRGHQLPPT